MRDFVEFMIKEFVTNPEAVVVSENVEENTHIISVKVANEDMGVVIGRDGKTINSIRNLAKAKAIKENIMIRIVLEEPQSESGSTNVEN